MITRKKNENDYQSEKRSQKLNEIDDLRLKKRRIGELGLWENMCVGCILGERCARAVETRNKARPNDRV